MEETTIETRRKALLAKVIAANPSDIETVDLLGEIEEFMTTLCVYPSPQLVQAQGVSDVNLIPRVAGDAPRQPLPIQGQHDISEARKRETILGGYRQWFNADADAFLAACEAPDPEGYRKVGSGGFVGTADLFIDYFVAEPPNPILPSKEAKPDDIPQDIWDTAEKLEFRVRLDFAARQYWDIRPTIARAILSERNRRTPIQPLKGE